jgi:hypothetical protein
LCSTFDKKGAKKKPNLSVKTDVWLLYLAVKNASFANIFASKKLKF